jgi:hypothetical protein
VCDYFIKQGIAPEHVRAKGFGETKDDLKVEADGWVDLLKEQAGRVDRNKIEAIEEMYMIENGLLQDAGSKLPTVERRSGEDRRKADSEDFCPRRNRPRKRR